MLQGNQIIKFSRGQTSDSELLIVIRYWHEKDGKVAIIFWLNYN